MDSLKESNTTTINNRSENGPEFDKNKDKNKDKQGQNKDKTKTLGESNKDTNKKSSLMKDKV